MALESATYISDLVSTNPTTSDPLAQGDDHIRLIKATVKATFPNVSGAVTPTHTELNYVDGVTSSIQTQLDAKSVNGTSAVHTAGSLELGHASDTTLTRSSAGVIAVEGGVIPKENRANTFTEDQTIASTEPRLVLSSSGPEFRTVSYRNGSNFRFEVGVDDGAETGANAGSSFFINRFNDAGVYISTPLSINRASGVTSIENLAVTSSATAPTASAYTNTTQLATTAQVYGTVTTLPLNYQTSSYTLVLSDAGKLMMMDSSSALTLTIPLNSSVAFPVGTRIDLVQWSTGQVTISATSGVGLRASGGRVKTSKQFAVAALVKMATDEWLLAGDLA